MPVRHPSDLVDDAAVGMLLRRIPASLYKYSGVSGPRLEWMRKLIVDSMLYFASPTAFNDPLDCRVPPRYDASALVIEQFFRRVAKQNYPGQNLRDHKRAIRQMVVDSKTPDGQARLTKQFFKSLHQNGTACFAKDATNMLLWSYYAEGHSGIAVRFNMARDNLAAIPGECIPVEVRDQQDFPNVNYYKSTTAEFVATILGTKSVAWKHEEEWRLVLVGNSGYVRMPPAMIDGVILGMRIDPEVESALRSCVGQRSPTVELFRVVHCPNSFKLQLVPA